jgi:hypothetical protein
VRQIRIIDRILLLGTSLLAAYQIITANNHFNPYAILGLTVGFGTLLVACILIIILGFEGLDRQPIVIVSTLIPLAISSSIVSLNFPKYAIPFLIFCVIGFLLVSITRFTHRGSPSTIILAVVHGIAGVTITILPLVHVILGQGRTGYILVSFGGGLIGIGGILLTLLRTGRPPISQERILTLLPILLFLMTTALIGGFSFL